MPAILSAGYNVDFIDADATHGQDDAPVGGLTVINFRNAHLVYAVTWFGLLSFACGFAWSYEQITDNVNNDFDGSHSGLGVYGELGVEFLHTHHTHLAGGVRLDAPFYSLVNERVSYSNNTSATVGAATIYYAPLSLEMRLTF